MSGSGRCPAGCGRAVLWTRSPAGRNLPLNPTPDPQGTWIPIAGRAYTRAALVVRGEPDGRLSEQVWLQPGEYVLTPKQARRLLRRRGLRLWLAQVRAGLAAGWREGRR